VVKVLKQLWANHKVLTLTFAVAFLFTVFFSFKTAGNYVYWSSHRDEAIRAWMTVRYIANSYRVEPAEIGRAIGLQPGKHDRRGIGVIARDQGVEFAELEQQIRTAIEASRADLPATIAPEPE
jgi:hypothetical protein